MARKLRFDIPQSYYHVINRANARMKIFENDTDYIAFESILDEGLIKFPKLRLVSYCIMPNHFHLLLYQENKKEISKFMHWITTTHTQRWHKNRGTTGVGHIYQGRYKSIVVENEKYYFTVIKYIERNPLRAGLAAVLCDWKWSSFYRKLFKNPYSFKLIYNNELLDKSHKEFILQDIDDQDLKNVRESIKKNINYGSEKWRKSVEKEYKKLNK